MTELKLNKWGLGYAVTLYEGGVAKRNVLETYSKKEAEAFIEENK